MKISVIIPVYNAEMWLERLLKSLKKQNNFEELEIIFIDDGSSDKSPEIIDEFVKNNINASVEHIKNNGVSNARNVGIQKATCEYSSFLDADDYIDADYFYRLLDEIENDSKIDLIVSGFVAEYEKKSIYRVNDKNLIINGDDIIKIFLNGDIIDPNVWNKLYKTKILKRVLFDSNFMVAEDKLFIYEYIKLIKKVKIVAFAKYHYVINENSVCRKEFLKKYTDSLAVAQKIARDVEKNYIQYSKIAKSFEMDVKCRVLCEISTVSNNEECYKLYNKLKGEIKHYRISEKMRYSNKKHFIAFVLCKISPKVYMYFKKKLKMQYKK